MPKRRGHGEGSITLRKDGRWMVRLWYYDLLTGCTERAHAYGKTRTAAVQKLNEMQAQVLGGKSLRRSRVKFLDCAEDWLAEKRGQVKPKTAEGYESVIRVHLRPLFKNVVLDDLQPAKIRHLLVDEAKSITPRVRENCLTVVRGILEYAVRYKMIAENAAAHVKVPKHRTRELSILSPEEVVRFLEGAKGDRLYAFYYLAFATGLRKGELIGLQWDEIDLKAGSMRVTRAFDDRRRVLAPLKTASSRRPLDLGPRTIAVLREHREKMLAQGHPHGFVFCTATGSPFSQSNITKYFRRVLRAAGLPQVRFHDVRHSAATLMLLNGTHPKIVSARLGHSKETLALSTYQHYLPALGAEAAVAVEELLTTSEPTHDDPTHSSSASLLTSFPEESKLDGSQLGSQVRRA